MGTTFARPVIRQTGGVEGMNMAELEKEIMSCPDIKGSWTKYEWNDDKDAFLIKWWGIKKQVDIAKCLLTTPTTCRARYRQLMEK